MFEDGLRIVKINADASPKGKALPKDCLWTPGVYACSKTGGKATYLHRLIAETPDGLDTDHRDGDGLNNRRRNLRPATESQNLLNVGPRKGKRFKGIFARPSGFVVRAPLANGKQKYLGTVKTAEQAAMIYDSYVAENCSEFARKNF